MKFVFLFLSLFLSILGNRVFDLHKHCEVIVENQKFCYEYVFENDCWPWKIYNCEIAEKSLNRPDCKRYNCPVSNFS